MSAARDLEQEFAVVISCLMAGRMSGPEAVASLTAITSPALDAIVAERVAALATPVFTAVVNATQGDPTGHLPDCGYTDEEMVCGCAEWGSRVHAAIAAALTERSDHA